MEAKTLVIVTLKNGSEKRVNSPEEPLTFINSMTADGSWAFKDVDGSWLIVNFQEYSTIELIPEE